MPFTGDVNANVPQPSPTYSELFRCVTLHFVH